MAKQNSTAAADKPAEQEPSGAVGPAAEEKPASAGVAGTVIYLGPTFSEDRTLYRHGQVFNNGLPAAWQKRTEADPQFRLLLVPVNACPEAVQKLRDPDSPLARADASVRRAEEERRAKRKGKK